MKSLTQAPAHPHITTPRLRLASWPEYLKAWTSKLTDEQVLLINTLASIAKGLTLLMLSTTTMGIVLATASAVIPSNISPQDREGVAMIVAALTFMAAFGLHAIAGPLLKKFVSAPIISTEGRPAWKFPSVD